MFAPDDIATAISILLCRDQMYLTTPMRPKRLFYGTPLLRRQIKILAASWP